MKSPFLVYEEFLSPLECEQIIEGNNNTYPNYDRDGKILPLYFGNVLAEVRITPRIVEQVIPDIESHFGVEVQGIKKFTMEWYATGYSGGKPRCENSIMTDRGWRRANNNDFTGVIFLNQYQDKTPFDDYFEVFGGRLEFPTHKFSFNPQRGTLIVFPGAPNFINHTEAVRSGELTQVRFHIATHELFVYDRMKFQGTPENWFKGELT